MLNEVDATERMLERPCAARIVHADCSHHGLVDKALKPSGALAAIVERAVCDARDGRSLKLI